MKKLFLIVLAMVLVSCKPDNSSDLVVVTSDITEIKLFSALCGGEIVNNGDDVIVARGVCWSTDPNPTIEDVGTTDGIGLGLYTSSLTQLNHSTTYYVRAYAVNAQSVVFYGEEKSFTTLPIEGTSGGYGWVDLGLPSGLKWSICNVGATTPEEYGDYYAWGELTTKETYDYSNCSTYEMEMSDISGDEQYDVAVAKWGNGWRMPTKDEMEELNTNCTWTWMTQNGVEGYKVTGPSGASIFLSASGYRYGSSIFFNGIGGCYWSSTPYDDEYNSDAYRLYFGCDYNYMNFDYRGMGQSIRPIIE